MRQFILIVIFVWVASFTEGKAQTKDGIMATNQVECESHLIHFRFAKAVVDSGYMDNSSSLRELDRTLTDKHKSLQIDSIVITASGSPEGVVEYNQALAERRAKAVKGYILWKYPSVNQHTVATHAIGEDWAGLQRMVKADNNAPYKEQIVKTLAQDINPSTKEWRLKQIDGGKAWNYITQHYLRHLRAAATCVVFYSKQVTEEPVEQPMKEIIAVEKAKVIEEVPVVAESAVAQPTPPQPVETIKTIKRPLFALKTNLLFDMATALNIELEVPISKRFSVAGEWLFPWWLWEKQQHCLQVLSGNLEFRYWLKPNFKKQHQPSKGYNPLTGWFVGVYGGGGLYDIEWDKKGYQGEFYIAAGVSGGYVQPLSRSLSMEFSIGVGYLQTDYRRYESRFSNVDSKWHPIRQQNGSYTWVGPTKAKVSLIWCPYFKKRGGRK